MNNHKILYRNGFTLIEVIVVAAILFLFAGAMIPFVYRVWESSEIETTKDRMTDLKKAMVGDSALIQNGVRTHFGYVGDIGQLPSSLENLISNVDGVSNWNGPYLPMGFDPVEFKTDAWGKEIQYYKTIVSGRRVSGQLKSWGPNRTDDGGSSDDIVINIDQNEVIPTQNLQGALNITFNTAPLGTLNYSSKICARYRDGAGNLTLTCVCDSPVSIPGNGSTRYFPIPFNVNLGGNVPVGTVYFSAALYSAPACPDLNLIAGQTAGGGPNNPEALVNVNDSVSSVFANLQMQSIIP